jgi:large conductance mechanosensitive channel
VDFKDLAIVLRPAEKDVPAVSLKYGLFLQSTIDFLIIAFVIFLMVKIITSMNRRAEAAPPAPTTKDCPKCLMAVPLKATKCGHCTVEIGG